eukprot:sb/3465729/
MLGGLAIVVLNIRICYTTYKQKPGNKNGQIDRIFRIQVAVYDLIMGVYLILLVASAIYLRFKGEYCHLDAEWRSSEVCAILGCIFSVSTHGSFLLITGMSIVRFLKCLDLVPDLSIRTVWVWTGLVGVLNVAHAVVPVVPIWQLQDFFRTSIILTKRADNPFIKEYNSSHLARMHSLLYNSSTQQLGMEGILSDMRNITSIPSIFDYTAIGYYGNSPLCVSNVFKNQPSYLSYKMGYCSVVAFLMALLSLSYGAILLTSRRTSSEAGANDTNNVKKLALKLAFLIGSQVVAWLSYLLTMFYYSWIVPTTPPSIVQEIFVLVLLPSNSLLNPIFYSDIYKTRNRPIRTRYIGHVTGYQPIRDQMGWRKILNREQQSS